MKKTFLPIAFALIALVAISCNSSNNDGNKSGNPQDAESIENQGKASAVAPITRDMEFMIFLHRFTADPDFQMDHIKFPLGPMSSAVDLVEHDVDDFTAKYWRLQDMNDLSGYFTWKNDNKIVYYVNDHITGDEFEFLVTYTFEKIDGDWYVTKGDYSGSGVEEAESTASFVKDYNKEYRTKHKGPFATYKYNGTPGDYPQASERLLNDNDLKGMSKKELRLMRNEIMARHGYTFTSNDLKKHFEKELWYFPLFKDVSKNLSSIESKNVTFIQQHEK